MLASIIRRFPHWIAVGLIAGLACGLYWPFLGNPRVFDDWMFFSGQSFSYYATHPFGLELRLPPYFSLAVTEVEIGGVVAHRIVSLAFHITCALALYKLIYDLLRLVTPADRSEYTSGANARTWALIGATVFAIHPVAVYGAAYLIQRTVVLATLFSMLSIVLFVRGLARGRHADAVSAALMYSVAVLSKEHSILLPGAASLAVLLVGAERRFAVRHASIYLLACAPAAIFVTLFRTWLIGRAYEPDFGAVANQIEGVFGHAVADFSWSLSAVVAPLSACSLRGAMAACVLAIPLLLYQAHDRLAAFSSSFLLWEDAVAKLPEKPVPWGSRTLYMMGREYLYGGRPDKAIQIAEKCMAQYPDTVHCHYARGVVHFQQGQYDLALRHLVRAVELQPDSGIAHHRLGLVVENLGRTREAKAEYGRASDLGFRGADFEIKRLESSGAGLPVRKRDGSVSR